MSIIDNKVEISNKLNSARSQNATIFVWQDHRDHIIKLPLKIHEVLLHDEVITMKAGPDELDAIEELYQEHRFFKFYLPTSSHLFVAQVIGIEPDGRLSVKFPETLNFIDRRKRERLYPEQTIRISLKKKGFEIHKNCYDFSLTGISVIFNQSEQSSFEEGEIIRDATLNFGHKPIVVEVKVEGLTKVKPFVFENIPYGHKKVAFTFYNPDEKTQKAIKAAFQYQKEVLEGLR